MTTATRPAEPVFRRSPGNGGSFEILPPAGARSALPRDRRRVAWLVSVIVAGAVLGACGVYLWTR